MQAGDYYKQWARCADVTAGEPVRLMLQFPLSEQLQLRESVRSDQMRPSSPAQSVQGCRDNAANFFIRDCEKGDPPPRICQLQNQHLTHRQAHIHPQYQHLGNYAQRGLRLIQITD